MDGGHGLAVQSRLAADLAEADQTDTNRCPFVDPIFVGPGFKDAGGGEDPLQDGAVALLADGVGGDQARRRCLACLDLRPGLLEPVGHQVGAAGHTAFIAAPQPIDVEIAQLAAHHLVAQEGRIADDHVRFRPDRFAAVGVEQRVAMLDAVQGAQDGVPGDLPAVAAAPLDVADPDGDAGEFGGVFVDFHAANVVRTGLHEQFGFKPEFLGIQMNLFFHIPQGLQCKEKKIPRSAGRIENLKSLKTRQKTPVGVERILVVIGATALVLSVGDGCFDRLPSVHQRFGNQRLDQFGNRAGVGVVSSQRRAGRRIKAALEEGAEDRRIDGAPVRIGGMEQGVYIVGGQWRNIDFHKKAAVEPGDVVVAVFAAGLLLHGGEKPGDPFDGLFGVVAGVLENFGEDVAGEQVFIFGEHAKQALNKKVGYALAVQSAFPHGLGQGGKVTGGIGCDRGGGFFGTELPRIREDPAQELPFFGIDQFMDADFARLVRVAGECGVNDDPLPVGDDQDGRIFQFQRIVGELLQGGVEVAPRLLVFPAEKTAFPDIGPAVAAVRFFGPAFEAIVVGVARLVHAEKIAQIVKMRLRSGALGEFVVFPDVNELFRRHVIIRSFIVEASREIMTQILNFYPLPDPVTPPAAPALRVRFSYNDFKPMAINIRSCPRRAGLPICHAACA